MLFAAKFGGIYLVWYLSASARTRKCARSLECALGAGQLHRKILTGLTLAKSGYRFLDQTIDKTMCDWTTILSHRNKFGIGHERYWGAAQFSSLKPLTRSNSDILLVTRVSPWERA